MGLRVLGSKTIRREVSDAAEVIIGPMRHARTLRLTADVMVFVRVTPDAGDPVDDAGYPVSDLMAEDIDVPQGHYLHVLGSEPGAVWLTEFAHG